MNLGPSITLVPILHGSAFFAEHVRTRCGHQSFDCIAVDLPEHFAPALSTAVDRLPCISAVTARTPEETVFYVPVDPTDAAIEAVRQSRQQKIPFFCIGPRAIHAPEPIPPMPDAYAAQKLGFDAFTSLCVRTLPDIEPHSDDDTHALFLAHRLHALSLEHTSIMAVVHLRYVPRMIHHYRQEYSHNASFTESSHHQLSSFFINPDHLYFALGELPFLAAKFEKERLDPFAPRTNILDSIKQLFTETRSNYYKHADRPFELSPAKIQIALTFLRNLSILSAQFMPALADIVEAARGVGGNSFALRVLENAKYYPYLPIEHTNSYLGVGIDKVTFPETPGAFPAVNLLRDTALTWRTLRIRPRPSPAHQRNYRYRWNPLGMCSHIPEDRRIERFNAHVRSKALRVLTEDHVKSEKFTSSVKDGIDFRETLRNWHTGRVYVKETPPTRGKVDTVVIIFDGTNDERYPHQATWYAEHPHESTLTFFATDPLEQMVGPGIARARYGGVSLLFPPRPIPNAFELTQNLNLRSLTERLTYGALMFSQEPNVAFIGPERPSLRLKTLAHGLGKHLVWIPLSTFSTEILERLQHFHVLNGKNVRSWASRFLGD